MTAATTQTRSGAVGEGVVVLGVLAILVVLFSPIPTSLLDFLLITNLSFALLVLLLTFYTDRPLAFSTFPSILLIATLFRLSLNVAATRLILTDANAGRVIHAVGTYVVSGNYVIGLVVFFILIVVQFVVVTNGAQRVAEVAARFTLDAMPGKQMSIDADLNMGLINEAEARTRRRDIEREANFYGAMDGASKFVKGDAIAGIIIILINIIGGLIIGLAQKGMDWATALRTFTLLTVGDGIVTQIPALVIATATGIIVTRAATDAQLGQELIDQVTRFPKSLLMLCGALTIALLLPGIPAVPVAVLLVLAGSLAFLTYRRRRAGALADEAPTAQAESDEVDLYSSLKVVPIELEFGAALKPLIGDAEGQFMRRLKAFRRQHALEQGMVIPAVRLKEDPRRAPASYAIKFFDATVAESTLAANASLAINPGKVSRKIEGLETKDPTFGLPAVWIDPQREDEARAAGYTVVDPMLVLVTHFTEIIRSQGYQLLTRRETEQLVGKVREAQPSLVEEMIPAVLTLSDVQKILQSLLRERVPIRNLEFILEALAEASRSTKESEALTERVREKLSLAICQRFSSRDGALHVLTLEPALDRQLREATRATEALPAGSVLDPVLLDRLTRSLMKNTEAMLSSNLTPVLLSPPALRRALRRITEGVLPHLNIVSSSEIPPSAVVRAFGTVAA